MPEHQIEDLRIWDAAHVFHPWQAMASDQTPRSFAQTASGIHIIDDQGRRLMDGPGGMWCMQLGYGQTEIAQAMADQAMSMAYCSPFSEASDVSARLAHEIAKRSPGDLNRVFFTTGGSTAVETAIRFAQFRNNILGKRSKKKVISRANAYHGGTYLTASLSGKQAERQWLDTDQTICHLIGDVNPLHRAEGQSKSHFRDAKVAELEQAIQNLGPDNVAAFIAEPLLASGGVVIPPQGYHAMCLEVCRKYDVLYISDEVVTGFGRLGEWFASDAVFGITPDIITCAKGLTAGYVPMGAALFSDRLFEGLGDAGAVFTSGFTYSGHPVSAAAALKVIEVFERENVLDHVRTLTPHFQSHLAAMDDLPIVRDTRGAGLVGCLECQVFKDGRPSAEGDALIGPTIDRHCEAQGLMVRPYGRMCIFSPPLIITMDEVDDLFAMLRAGVQAATDDLLSQGFTLTC